MIKTIHKYQNSILLYFVMFVVAFSMVGFGVDFLGQGPRQDYAIRIDDHEISYTDFYRYRRDLEDYYRAIFGGMYSQVVESQQLNLTQRTVDQLIPAYLLEHTAKKLGLRVGPREIADQIRDRMPGKVLDQQTYAAFLRQEGLTAPQFESRIASEALREQLQSIIFDMSRASKAEAAALLERDETKYNAAYVSLSPAAMLEKVPAPAEQELQTYFQEHSEHYQLPPRVGYQFVAFDAKKQQDIVQVPPEEIELYYNDHEDDFRTPARADIQVITLTVPEKADDAARGELKKKAEEVEMKAAAGEDFNKLAETYSDDLKTRLKGGEFGWVTRGDTQPAKPVVDAALKLGGPGAVKLVETPKAFYVVKARAFEQPRLKPLAEVSKEIEAVIRQQEAPAWVSEHAHGLFDEWQQSGKPLAEFAKDRGLELRQTSEPLADGSEPDGGFQGLTRLVVDKPDQQQQIVETGDKLALVQVTEFKEAEIPPMSQATERLLNDYKAEKAAKMAADSAAQLVNELKEKKAATLAEAAKKFGAEIKEVSGLKRQAPAEAPFNDAQVRDALFSAQQANQIPSSSYKVGDSYYIFQVTAIDKPDLSKLQDKLEDYQKRATQLNAQVLVTSLINELKMNADIDVSGQLTE